MSKRVRIAETKCFGSPSMLDFVTWAILSVADTIFQHSTLPKTCSNKKNTKDNGQQCTNDSAILQGAYCWYDASKQRLFTSRRCLAICPRVRVCAPIRRASSLRRAQNPTEALGEGLHRGKRARARAACKRGKRLTRFIYSMTKK